MKRRRHILLMISNSIVLQTLGHWRHYLLRKEFGLFSDHDALKHLHFQQKLCKHCLWWSTYLQEFTFVIDTRPAKKIKLQMHWAAVSIYWLPCPSLFLDLNKFAKSTLKIKILAASTPISLMAGKLNICISIHDSYLFCGTKLSPSYLRPRTYCAGTTC